MTVNDLLGLLALRDQVIITGNESGETYHDGLVEDVPPNVRAMEPHAIVAVAQDYLGYDAIVQILVSDR